MKVRYRLILLILCCFISFSKSQSITDLCTTPKSETGRCINIYQCKPMINVLSFGLNDEMRLKLKEYFCGYDFNKQPKVCCPEKPIFESKDCSSSHPNINLLPENCGETAPIVQITNGENADLFEFPWQVALKYESKNKIPYHCGGTLRALIVFSEKYGEITLIFHGLKWSNPLINKRYVLTAAHCITNRLKLISLRLGEYDLLSTRDCIKLSNTTICAPPVQDFNISIKDAIVHPLYKENFLHDIALIRLPRDAKFNDAVKPICLPINKSLIPKNMKGLTVVGWGSTRFGTKSSTLRKVAVPYRENSVCNEIYKHLTQIDDTQLCAGGTDNKDSCNDDSGGPIMVALNVGGIIKTVQVGLVAFGHTICGKEFYPSVYTRLTSYTDWILDNIRS